MPRSFLRERAVTATTSIGRPQRAARTDTLAVDEGKHRGADRAKPGQTHFERDHRQSEERLTPRGKGNDVVQRFGARFKETADIPRGLADALLVLDQRNAHMVLAVLPEAGTRRDCD